MTVAATVESREEGARVLVLDDDPGVVDFLVEMLDERGFRCAGQTSPEAALAALAEQPYDVLVSDVEMPGIRGLDLLPRVQALRPLTQVVLITAFGSIDMAVEAVRAGAADFVAKPFKIQVLVLAIERALRERRLRRELVRLRSTLNAQRDTGATARAPASQRVLELAARAARTRSTVLIVGESGSGKGYLARRIHAASACGEGPFVQVNCAAIPASLVESELFGVRKGAFTDAREDRTGLVEQAHGGTLFLDEVAEMPLESQVKLLNVLETGVVRPLGGSKEVRVEVRVIAATNAPLEEAMREKRFRQDLYYRLNVIRLEMPPLRERLEDLEALVDILLERACARLGREVVGVSQAALRRLRSHTWPGNVRELANVLERAVAMTDYDTIVAEDLEICAPVREADFLADAAAQGLALAEVERAYIAQVLAVCEGNRSKAARVLGIDRRTLYRKLEEEGP